MKELINEIKKATGDKEKIYIYGAGLRGRDLYKMLKNSFSIDGFIVTNDMQSSENLFGLPVYRAETINFNEAVVIIGANRRNTVDILKYLEEKNCNVICACEYMEKRKIEGSNYNRPWIEVTTVIGCKVNCKFCPQDLLINKYFENNVKREYKMSMETFSKCLEHLPKECNIKFCGMAEPFLNPLCTDMILKAYETGREIELFTTLVGADKQSVEKIWDLPFTMVNIHVPDENQYANIPLTDEYYELLKLVLEHKKPDGSAFVNMCNSQAEPLKNIKEICSARGYEIITTLNDRAGNLEGNELVSRHNGDGKLVCTLCGENLNHNVLLPDGTLLLCCVDYSMKHILGNLVEEEYEKIMNNDEVKNIKDGLQGNVAIDILCRKCSYANRI